MKILFKILVLAFFLSSCSKEPVETVFKEFDTSSGVFIACEGNFMYGNGSLSFYNDKKKIVNNRLFYVVNNVPPGDVVQSVELYGDNLFIVVNNSGKLYVVDARTIGFKAVITGLTSPRYIYFTDNGKAYISDLYAGHITVFDPVTFEKTGIIDLDGHKSEKMVQLGRFVYVTSWLFD
ncbi:MAG: YncE family protein, partial [Bacteroidales bacterium]|nr:YncE family protein [Bacteroidales bacterium]